MPPLPVVSNALRLKATGDIWGAPFLWRLFFAYTGGPPSAVDCASIANAAATHWGTRMAADAAQHVTYTGWEVQDLASATGAVGTSSTSVSSTNPNPAGSSLNAVRIKFRIARHYRGGHPGVYLPPLSAQQVTLSQTWAATNLTDLETHFVAWISDMVTTTAGTTNVTNHINISYYQGFTNATTSSGRNYSKPTPRATPLKDIVSAYTAEKEISTQRRRGSR